LEVRLITLVLIGLVGGLITGVSPCVLPVLPVIFLSGGAAKSATAAARDRRRPFLVVAGLTISFSAFTLLGTLVLSALPLPKDIIRWTGLVVLVLVGIAMLFPRVQDVLERPFAKLPQRRAGGDRGGFVLGLALGAVYVPCAGPVLAAITVAGATGKIGGQTIALTIAFAIGTAVPLLAFALAGRGVAERVKAFRTRQRAVRIGAGVVLIALAVALTFNLPDVLQRAVPDYTAGLNTKLVATGTVSKVLAPTTSVPLAECAQDPEPTLQECGTEPAIGGIQQWFNTPSNLPLTLASLKGKVVLIDFWAYSCINCQRAIKHVDAWYSTYERYGLEVIGVHTPEYAFEHVASNVVSGAKRLGIAYPVALDNNYTTWNNFGNDSWPADYLIDSTGEVRHVAIGEGGYSTTESMIRQLLTAADPSAVLPAATEVADNTPTSLDHSPETYLGSEREDAFDGQELSSGTFAYPSSVPQNAFALTGVWSVGTESLTSQANAGIRLNFDAKDVYLDVGGTGTLTATVGGKTTTYQVLGAPNIYTVVSQKAEEQQTLTVALSPGLSAYSFTFG
jgi:cytochrome c biogenesis protein CcdA/thiol-disulfide isomerase/thioredoxin